MLRKYAAITAVAAGCAFAQQAGTAPDAARAVPDDAVVVVLNGKNYTAKDIKTYVSIVPPQAQAAFKADPKQFLRDHAWYLKLVEYAEKNDLDKISPIREQLEFARLMLLSQAAYNYALKRMPVTPDEQKAHYEKNKEAYREARVRMIYIPFSDLSSEGEAKTKAEEIVKRARAGEDFIALVKAHSDQSAQSESEQTFTVRRDSKQPPEEMRRVILSLKQGEITNALRHENGYYVFRVESADVLPFEQVRDEIYLAIQNAKFREWERTEKAQATAQFENESFFESIGSK